MLSRACAFVTLIDKYCQIKGIIFDGSLPPQQIARTAKIILNANLGYRLLNRDTPKKSPLRGTGTGLRAGLGNA